MPLVHLYPKCPVFMGSLQNTHVVLLPLRGHQNACTERRTQPKLCHRFSLFSTQALREQSSHHFRSSSFRATIPGVEKSRNGCESLVVMTRFNSWIREKSSRAGLQACSINLLSNFPMATRATLLKYKFDHDIH